MSGWTLVTGGAKGLGAEICRTLAANGHSVVIHYRASEKEALKVAEECKAFGQETALIQGDFSTPDSLQDFIHRYTTRFSLTSALINNVGHYVVCSALLTKMPDWIELFQVNVHAPFAITQALAASLKKEKGSVVNIGFAGIESLRAETYAAAYSLTKNSLWMLTKSLAKELASEGVNVNMVSPGHLENSIDLPADLSCLPMKKAGTLAEVARVVAFLVNEESHYITGQNIAVAGGVKL